MRSMRLAEIEDLASELSSEEQLALATRLIEMARDALLRPTLVSTNFDCLFAAVQMPEPSVPRRQRDSEEWVPES